MDCGTECVNMHVCDFTDVLSLTSASCGVRVTSVVIFTRPRSAHLQHYNTVNAKSRHIFVRHIVTVHI